MKKFTFAAVIAMACAAFTSCGNGSASANLENDIDSLSYAIGMANTQGLKESGFPQMGLDTTDVSVNNFLKGFQEGLGAADDKEKMAYIIGMVQGMQNAQQIAGFNKQMLDSVKTINMKNFYAGLAAALTGKDQRMTMPQAMQVADAMMQKIQKEKEARDAKEMEKQFGDYKKQNEQFLADNKSKEGVKVLPSGVQYKVIKEGTGEKPGKDSRVKVHYEGKTIDGKVFDSSFKRGEPIEMLCSQVIPGWTDALVNMPAGSKWEVYIPQSLAYGANAQGDAIKPFSTLIFTIELIEVMPTAKPQAAAAAPAQVQQ